MTSQPGWFWAAVAAMALLATLAAATAGAAPAAFAETPSAEASPQAGSSSAQANPSLQGAGAVPAGWVSYTVKPGDTLYRLAHERGVSVAELSSANGLADPSKIRAGQVIYVPPLPRSAELASRGAELPQLNQPSVLPTSAAAATSSSPAPAREVSPVHVTAEERDLLARLVTAEARNEPLDGQTAVAAVVLNRLRHPAFPKTLAAVILEPGQFKCVENGGIKNPPTGSALLAVDRALVGEDPSNGALFFYNPATTTTPGWWSTRAVTARIGNHNFAR